MQSLEVEAQSNPIDQLLVSEVNVNDGMVCKVQTTAFQAVTLIAYCFLHDESS